MHLPNVHFLPEVPSSRIPAYLSAADTTIVPLRDEPVFRGALPSKMFEAWACARPTILSVAGEAEQVLTEAGAGIAIPPEDPAAMASAILSLHDHPDPAQQMGKRGRRFVLAHYSRRAQAQALESLLAEVQRSKHGPGRR
jgi:glycosyltransferase involved in cell wall biosynthesis